MSDDQNRHRVLLVEDDTSLSHLIQQELERIGMSVTSTDSSIDAIMKLQQDSYSVMLLDIMLSGSSGLYVVDALRDLPAYERPRVIVITGARGTILTNIDRTVVKAVFFKPLEIGSLVTYVKSLATNGSAV
jgi:DNA-binding response OmpR family regulator